MARARSAPGEPAGEPAGAPAPAKARRPKARGGGGEPTDPVSRYARGVLAGEIPAGRLVRLACERHLRDLETGAARGIFFDAALAERAIAFFGFLRHSKGEWAGEVVQLQPWQQFIVGSLFGWLRADGTRRFRTGYDEVPRKNGKSTKAAGIGLYLFVADGEQGAEVYSAATKKDQARIVWSEAKRMVLRSPALRSRVSPLAGNLSIERTASKFEALGADESTLDGLNIHGAIVDEVHAHRTRGVVDVLETATGARRQPLIFYITTAGYDRQSVCWELHDYSIKVLEGIYPDDSWFAYIATIDDGDDWRDPATWAKANPNLGVSVKVDDLQRKAEKAARVPSARNAFLRLHLNVWTEQAQRAIDIEAWKRCGGALDESQLAGRPCYLGLDLSSKRDLSAACYLFPPLAGESEWRALWRFYMPEANVAKRVEEDRVRYDVWIASGHIRTTPGNVVDYDFIRADLLAEGPRYALREVAFDPWNAQQLATDLQNDGLELVEVRQTFAGLAGATKEFVEVLVPSGTLRHGDNPVATWMASNFAVRMDPAGNMRPDKKTAGEKIDGLVALVTALARAILQPETFSVYETRGVIRA